MTTGPEHFEGEALSFHGAYRGREVTAEAFFAAMRLLELAGHREPKRRGDSEEPPDTYVFAFRQVAPRAREGWTALFRGEDAGVLREMAVALLDRPRARQAAAEVQRDLAAVVAFFEGQARPLREMVEAVGHVGWPVDALLRDPLHARWRLTRS